MNFYEVTDQIVKRLQQRGRLVYRVFKLQFKLDDETLEDWCRENSSSLSSACLA